MPHIGHRPSYVTGAVFARPFGVQSGNAADHSPATTALGTPHGVGCPGDQQYRACGRVRDVRADRRQPGQELLLRHQIAAGAEASGAVRDLRLRSPGGRHRRRRSAARAEARGPRGDAAPGGASRALPRGPGPRRARGHRPALPRRPRRVRRTGRRLRAGPGGHDVPDLGRARGVLPRRGRLHRPPLARRVQPARAAQRPEADRGARGQARPRAAADQHPPGRARGPAGRPRLPAAADAGRARVHAAPAARRNPRPAGRQARRGPAVRGQARRIALRRGPRAAAAARLALARLLRGAVRHLPRAARPDRRGPGGHLRRPRVRADLDQAGGRGPGARAPTRPGPADEPRAERARRRRRARGNQRCAAAVRAGLAGHARRGQAAARRTRDLLPARRAHGRQRPARVPALLHRLPRAARAARGRSGERPLGAAGQARHPAARAGRAPPHGCAAARRRPRCTWPRASPATGCCRCATAAGSAARRSRCASPTRPRPRWTRRGSASSCANAGSPAAP